MNHHCVRCSPFRKVKFIKSLSTWEPGPNAEKRITTTTITGHDSSSGILVTDKHQTRSITLAHKIVCMCCVGDWPLTRETWPFCRFAAIIILSLSPTNYYAWIYKESDSAAQKKAAMKMKVMRVHICFFLRVCIFFSLLFLARNWINSLELPFYVLLLCAQWI